MRAALLAALCGVGVLLAGQPQAGPFVIRNVRVFDGVSVRQLQSVVVRAGYIESIGPADALDVPDGAEEVRGDGRTLLPGLIDSHVHVAPQRSTEALQQALVLGVTTVVTPALGDQLDAAGFADAQISDGADVIEVIQDDSHDADLTDRMANANAVIIPMLSALYRLCGTSDGQAVLSDAGMEPYVRAAFRPSLQLPPPATNRSCRRTREAARQLPTANAVVLAGTDAPSPGTTYGASLHWELGHLVKAGLSPTAALRAATSAAADAFQMPDRGRIAPGLRADLILVNGDPTSTIRVTRRIEAVWKRGERVRRTP